MKTFSKCADDIASGSLILVNADHPMRRKAVRDNLMAVSPDYPGILLERQVVSMLAQALMVTRCGDSIVPVSGYRSAQEQHELYALSVREYGAEFTRRFVALPGCSEHQTGLAIDLAENAPEIDFIRPHFPYTGICRTFREISVRYGFIERYPAGGERLTQIAHKPWHFRYVGYPHSELMTHQKLTLEEYTDYLKGFAQDGSRLQFRTANRDFEIYYVPVRSDEVVQVEIPEKTLYQLSGNNVDGLVVTLYGSPA